MDKNEGGRPPKTGNTQLPVSLSDIGITKMQSSRELTNGDESSLQCPVLPTSKSGITMNPAPKAPDESTYSGRFAARLRSLREKAGLSVDDVVAKMEKAGYPLRVQTYYGWENGRRQVNWDALPAIAKALKVKPRDVIPEK